MIRFSKIKASLGGIFRTELLFSYVNIRKRISF